MEGGAAYLQENCLDWGCISAEQGGNGDLSSAASCHLLPNLTQQAKDALRRVVESAQAPDQSHTLQDAWQQSGHILDAVKK